MTGFLYCLYPSVDLSTFPVPHLQNGMMISTPVSELNMRGRHGTLKDTGALGEKQTCLRPAFLLAV